VITADTITDEQIESLWQSVAHDRSKRAKQIREWCDIARHRFALVTARGVRAAKARCAEILNARK
jgi:hypothetical protein